MVKKLFLIFSFFSIFFSNFSFSKEKLITSIISLKDNKIEFFLGYKDNIKSGDELYILRGKEEIGKIKVTEVKEYSSWGEIIELREDVKIELTDSVSNFPGEKSLEEKKVVKIEEKKETSETKKKISQERYITGKIIVILKNNLIIINLGKENGVKENYEFIIIRDNNLIGRCKVTSDIRNYTSICEVTKLEEGKEISRGDKVLTTKTGIAPKWNKK
jgi:hypothetical protein